MNSHFLSALNWTHSDLTLSLALFTEGTCTDKLLFFWRCGNIGAVTWALPQKTASAQITFNTKVIKQKAWLE